LTAPEPFGRLTRRHFAPQRAESSGEHAVSGPLVKAAAGALTGDHGRESHAQPYDCAHNG
jgi:hypothetical protein